MRSRKGPRDPAEFLARRFERKIPQLDQIGRGLPFRDQRTGKWTFFCPLCESRRALSHGPQAGTARHFFQVGLTTAVVMLAFWPLAGWKGAIVFVPIWGIFETVYRLRTRADLVCDSCGFDPTLYLADTGRARAEVEQFWRKRFADRGLPFPGDPEQLSQGAEKPAPSAPSQENSP